MNPPPIQVMQDPGGTVRFLVDGLPDTLPPVLMRDLDRAWAAAHRPGHPARPGNLRLLRFQGAGGRRLDMLLQDRDARRWADAADTVASMGTCYGMSLCLRLLSLVQLLLDAPWAGQVLLRRGDCADLPPALRRLACDATLLPEGGFDAQQFRAALHACPVLA